MNTIISLPYKTSNPKACFQKLEAAFERGFWVELLHSSSQKAFIPNDHLPIGPGIIISSSGSHGGPKKCLHPYQNMDQSALATAQWLIRQGINPKNCQIINGLPFNHVSGLMPWWRSKRWEAEHIWIDPVLMRSPLELEKYCQPFMANQGKHLITSLVPTQLKRLLDHSAGIQWLQAFSVIWIGGSPLPEQLAQKARRKRIRLAPCYGTSETMAMIAALFPDDFLKGRTDCGMPMIDIELRLRGNEALEIRTPRLATSINANGSLTEIDNKDGWWESGDSAQLIHEGNQIRVQIIGRRDTAIHSGGETIFPEKLQEKLLTAALENDIPVESLLLLGTAHEEWGERLIALVRLSSAYSGSQSSKIFIALKKLVKQWSPAEKPMKWYQCQQLTTNGIGKWEVNKWREWIKSKQPIIDRSTNKYQ